MGDALNIDVRIFVEELVLAVEKWLTTVETTLEYQKNIASGVKRYPNGLPPYIVGLPVIASPYNPTLAAALPRKSEPSRERESAQHEEAEEAGLAE